MFQNIPILARKYRLEQIRPCVDGKWPKQAVHCCYTLIVFQLCYVRVSGSNYLRDKTPCSIAPPGLRDLKEILIEYQLAEHVRRVPVRVFAR